MKFAKTTTGEQNREKLKDNDCVKQTRLNTTRWQLMSSSLVSF